MAGNAVARWSSRLVNVQASLQFAIVFTILIMQLRLVGGGGGGGRDQGGAQDTPYIFIVRGARMEA